MDVEKLLELIEDYNPGEVEKIKRDYLYAAYLHDGQYRESGEAYIIHPLNVAYILAEMHADSDTVCAGLLHDVLEDTKASKEDIQKEFNNDIASLVDGVTKLAKMNFSTKEEMIYANTRKIITSITEDVRIIIIKLADRLHNMRTLEYKTPFKQKENSLETMEIFVPIAYSIGAYRIKSELEDLAFRYLKPDKYQEISDQKEKIEIDSQKCLNDMLFEIYKILSTNNITSEIKIRTKNIYGIYKREQEGNKITTIHDLLALKIMVDTITNCYISLGLVHSKYHPINDKFKDFICNPKTNMYQSLHTTVFGPDDHLVQTQIRTFAMDKVASFGLTTYWDLQKGEARNEMQKDLRTKFQFYRSLSEINDTFRDNESFVLQVKNELFSDQIFVYTTRGEAIALPKGSTPIDFAYAYDENVGNKMSRVYVNYKKVKFNHQLQNKDRVRIIMNSNSFPKKEWLEEAKTTLAKMKIKEYLHL